MAPTSSAAGMNPRQIALILADDLDGVLDA
jgi:hypothetical protein